MQSQDLTPQSEIKNQSNDVIQSKDEVQDTSKAEEKESQAQFEEKFPQKEDQSSLNSDKDTLDFGQKKNEPPKYDIFQPPKYDIFQTNQTAQFSKPIIFAQSDEASQSYKSNRRTRATLNKRFENHPNQQQILNSSNLSGDKSHQLQNPTPQRPQGEDEVHLHQDYCQDSTYKNENQDLSQFNISNNKSNTAIYTEEIKEQPKPNSNITSLDANSHLEANFTILLEEEGFEDVDDLKNQYQYLKELLEKSKRPNKKQQDQLAKMHELLRAYEEIQVPNVSIPDSSIRIQQIKQQLEETDLDQDIAYELLQFNEKFLEGQKKAKRPKEDEILETLNKISLLKEFIQLKKGGDNPRQPELKDCQNMDPKEKHNFLTNLLIQRPLSKTYKDHLLEESKDEISKPPQKSRLINSQALNQNWAELSISLFNVFIEGNTHWAMKTFYLNENQSLINPTVLFDAFSSFKSINPPQACQEMHLNIIDTFSVKLIDETLAQIELLIDKTENSEYRQAVSEAIKELQKSIMKGDKIGSAYRELQSSLPQFRGIPAFNSCFESMIKRKSTEAVHHLKQLLKHCDSKNRFYLMKMYQNIIKIDSQYKQQIPIHDFLRELSPKNLQGLVETLVEEVSKAKLKKNQFKVGTLNDPSDLLEILSKIFLEDQEFCTELIDFVGLFEEMNQILDHCKKELRTLKQLQMDHLNTAYSQIRSKNNKQKNITKFLALDPEQTNYEVLQRKIIGWLLKDGQVDEKSLSNILYELIKKKCNFSDLITALKAGIQSKQGEAEGKKLKMVLSQQFLLAWLLNNSDTYLRTMLLNSCSTFMPVPLITYQKPWDNNEQFYDSKYGDNELYPENSTKNQTFLPLIQEELFYCFEKNHSVLNFKVSSNKNKSPQGCTSLANEVFNRKFETHSSSFVNYGCIDLQFDYNFEFPMYIPVADAHGLVENEILSLIYPLFNIFCIHLFTGDNDKKVLNCEIEKIKRVQKNPLIFIIYHDDTLKDNQPIRIPVHSKINQGIFEIYIKKYIGLPEIEQKTLKNFMQEIFIEKVSQQEDDKNCSSEQSLIKDSQSQDAAKKIQIGKDYESNDAKRVESLRDFLSFAKNFQEYRQKRFSENGSDSQTKFEIENSLQLIIKFMKIIEPTKQQLRSNEVLPLNELFSEASMYDRIMVRGNIPDKLSEKKGLGMKQNKGEAFQQLRNQINELYKNMNNSQHSQLTLCINDIIENRNYLGLTTLISKFIRSFLGTLTKNEQEVRQNLTADYQKFLSQEKSNKEAFEKQIKELQQEILTQRTKFQNLQGQGEESNLINAQLQKLNNQLTQQKNLKIEYELKIQNMLSKIREITSSIEKKWFSLEFLYREFYIHGYSQLVCNPQSQSTFKDYLTLASIQVGQGQPFELIDGNNLQFIKDVYQQIVVGEAPQSDIMVISIVGPQSSGKSLLLNTLFGAQFLSSAGRCTRGVYGCLLDIKGNAKFKKVLILDTEGIQSTESVDSSFDKRVVFYILSVSHIVLICNKGEINQGMQDILKLAIDCISQLKQTIATHPQVNIIMNNTTSNANLYQTTQNLSDQLYAYSSSDIFRIDTDNVFLLPNAFAQSGYGDFISYNPSLHFASKVDELKKKIFDFINFGDSDNFTAKFNLKGWFQHAQQWWDFTDSYKGLTDYSTLQERLEDNKALEFVNEIISQCFDNPDQAQKNLQQVKNDVHNILKKHSGFDQTNIKDIQDKIMKELQEGIIKKINNDLEKKFKIFVDENCTSVSTIKKRKETLFSQIETRVFEWKNEAMKMLSAHSKNQSKFIGYKFLNEAIDQLIKESQENQSGIAVTVQEAEQKFEKCWKNIKKQLIMSMKPEESIKEESENSVSQVYNSHGKTNNLQKVELEVKLMTEYENIDADVIANHFKQEQEFFYFKPILQKPSIQQLIDKQNKAKHYFQKKDLQFFEENRINQYFQWIKFIQERFEYTKFQNCIKKINEQCYKQKEKNFQFMRTVEWERQGIEQEKLNKLIKDIKKEARGFQINITQSFESQLLSLEDSIKLNINQHTDQQYKDENQRKKEIQIANDIITDFVRHVEENISQYFMCSPDKNSTLPSYPTFFNLHKKKINYQGKISYPNSHYFIQDYLVNFQPQEQVNNLKRDELFSTDRQVHIKQEVQQIRYFLYHIIDPTRCHINPQDIQINIARTKFTKLLDSKKLLKDIQNAIFSNIFKSDQERKKLLMKEEEKDGTKHEKTMEELIQKIRSSDDIEIPGNFVTINFETTHQIVQQIELIGENINNDLEFCGMRVSDSGLYCLHRITKAYLIRLMREVKKITEHTPIHSFNKSYQREKDLFVAKLTSNDQKADNLTANNIALQVAEVFSDHQNDLKSSFTKYFKRKIESEQDKFNLKNIRKDIEAYIQNQGFSPNQTSNPFIQLIHSWSPQKIYQTLQELKNHRSEIRQLQELKQFRINPESVLELTAIDLIQFYVDPANFLERIFIKRWDQVAGPMIEKIQAQYLEKIQIIRHKCVLFFNQFQEKCEEKKIKQLAAEIFYPCNPDGEKKNNQGMDIKLEVFKQLSQKALASYFLSFISKEDSYEMQGFENKLFKTKLTTKILNVTTDVTMQAKEPLLDYRELNEELDQQVLKIIMQFSSTINGISNLSTFLKDLAQSFNTHLDPSKNEKLQLSPVEIYEETLKTQRKNMIGCQKFCPLCRRQCDVQHNSDDQMHSCESHQIQGFGGNLDKQKNQVCVISCQDFTERDKIQWEGAELEWPIFVLKMKQEYKFNIQTESSRPQRKQSAQVWNQIGKLLCDTYLIEGKILPYQNADEDYYDKPPLKTTLYILLLDESTSMQNPDGSSGKSIWETLMIAAKKFANQLESPILSKYSRITIITYNTQGHLKGKKLNPEEARKKLENLYMNGGGTNFGQALKFALEEAQQEHNNHFDLFNFIMMSDGGDKYPNQEVVGIQNSDIFKKKIFKFTAIGHGDKDFSSLIRIASELGGTMEKTAKPFELQQTFIRLAPNAYGIDQKK